MLGITLQFSERECVDVTFQDGRKIKFTSNHKLLTSENTWTEINKFVINETSIKTGITYPLIKVNEELTWELLDGNRKDLLNLISTETFLNTYA